MATSIFVDCGGTLPANGFYLYYFGDGSYVNIKNSNYVLRYNNGYWELLLDASYPTVLYRLSAASSSVDPASDTSWQIIDGISPTIKSFNGDNFNITDSFSNYVYGTIVVVGADITATNGSYIKSGNEIWTHTNGLYQIAFFGSSRYAIYHISTNTPIYLCDNPEVPNTPAGFHPVTIYDNLSTWTVVSNNGGITAPTSSYYNTTAICAGGGGTVGGETTPFLTGKYVYTKDNIHYIRLANNQPYVR